MDIILNLRYEKFFGKSVDFALCVSKAMKKDLEENWGVPSPVVYDKPNTAIFKSLKLEEKHELFKKLGFKAKNSPSDETLFTI